MPRNAVDLAPGRVLSSGRFRIAETGDGELVAAWQPDDGPGGEVRLPPPLYALMRRAAAGEEISAADALAVLAGALRPRRRGR